MPGGRDTGSVFPRESGLLGQPENDMAEYTEVAPREITPVTAAIHVSTIVNYDVESCLYRSPVHTNDGRLVLFSSGFVFNINIYIYLEVD